MEIVELHFPTLPSTNRYGKEHLSTFDRDKLTVITTDEQTHGKGRYGREWHSPAHENITLSFAFFISEDCEDPLSLTHVLAIVLVEELAKKGINARIKWPNDVLVNDKKIAGILCESLHMPPHFGVVIGVGLNVNMPPETLQQVGQPATSILNETDQKTDIKLFTNSIVHAFSHALVNFKQHGFTPFSNKLRKLIINKK